MKWFLPLFLLLTNTVWAVDNVIGTASNNVLLDNASRKWDANVFYTTDGNGNVLTLLDQSLVSDSVSGLDGNNYFTDNAGRVWQANVCYTTDGNGNVVPITGGGGAGTVTSVGLSLPNIFSVSGSPITTFGTLTSSLVSQSANTVFAGPSTGLSATPSFRALVAADIPSVSASKITSGQGSISSTTTGVTVTNGSNATLGPNTTVNIQTASGSQPGLLSSTDWTTFNNKQPAGSYITALTGDVTASGPGSASATIANLAVTNAKIANSTIDLTSKVTGLLPNANLASIQYSGEKWVQVDTGDDSLGDGSFQRPWKTLGHACGALVVTTANLIHMTGFSQDSSASAITCPALTTIVSDNPYASQIMQPITITGAIGNSYVAFEHVVLFGSLTWTRSDPGASTMNLINSFANGGITFKNTGAGMPGSFLSIMGGDVTTIDAICGQISLQSTGMFGNLTYEDSGPSYLVVSATDLAGAISLNGGVSAWITGSLADAGYSISGTTTGSGTPSIVGADSGSLPPAASITGAVTPIGLTSLAIHESYTPVVSANWSTIPTTVSGALDSLVVLQQSAVGSQPACTSANRGLSWLVQGGAGVADIYQICQKNASDVYVWTTH